MSPGRLKSHRRGLSKEKANQPAKALVRRKKLEETFKKMNGYYESSGIRMS
jgi:hypothetical protein